MTKISSGKITEYQKIFGAEKMRQMWQVFSSEAETCLGQAGCTETGELRLKFHNLRSASLVFGMNEFSGCCRRIEEAVINGAQTSELAKEIEQAKILFGQQRQEISAFIETEA